MRKMLSISLPQFYLVAIGWDGSDGVPALVSRDGTVLDASLDARVCGVAEGMPIRNAVRLSPSRVFPEDPARARVLHRKVWGIVASHTPLVETTDYHTGFANLTGCLRPGESLAERASRLRDEIHQATGLRARIGGGSTLLSAQIASRSGDDGFLPRFLSEERRFLWGSMLATCSAVPSKITARLSLLGLETFGDLLRFTPEQLAGVAGKRDGWTLYHLSRLEEVRPLRPNYPPETLVVSKGFVPPTEHEQQIVAWLSRLCDRGNRTLAARGLKAMEMSLTLHLVDGSTRIAETRFSREGIGSFARSFRAEGLLRGAWLGEELERLTLTFDALELLIPEQTTLWDDGMKRQQENAVRAIEMTRARFGTRGLSFAKDVFADAGIPGAWVEPVLSRSDLIPAGAGWYG
jgi:nucleotidyltransferase/DNA polymerase involved in DNA repair